MSFQKKKKVKANKVATWIVNSILKLDDKNLLNFYQLISDELLKRGVINVWGYWNFINSINWYFALFDTFDFSF